MNPPRTPGQKLTEEIEHRHILTEATTDRHMEIMVAEKHVGWERNVGWIFLITVEVPFLIRSRNINPMAKMLNKTKPKQVSRWSQIPQSKFSLKQPTKRLDCRWLAWRTSRLIHPLKGLHTIWFSQKARLLNDKIRIILKIGHHVGLLSFILFYTTSIHWS